MKTVFSNSQTAHVWASQTQAYGRSSNRNLYFRGSTLFSYGPHFAVGRIMAGNAVLLNSDGYSVSTARHKREAWSAVRHKTTYDIPHLTALDQILNRSDGKERRAAVRKFVQDNVRSMTTHAAAYLLTLAGTRDAGAKVEFYHKRADKRAADSIVRGRIAETKARLAYGRTAIKHGFRRELDKAPQYELDSAAQQLHRAHRAFLAGKAKLQAAKVWELLKQVRAEQKRRERKQEAFNRRWALRHNIDQLRSNLDQVATSAQNGGPISTYTARTTRDLATLLSKSGRTTRAHASLTALANGFDEAVDKLQAIEDAQALKRAAQELADWKAGTGRAYGLYGLPVTYMRAVNVARDDAGNITGGTLQTTRGAEVPLVHAIRAFKFVKRVRDSGKPWHANGHSVRVGHFTVDSIDADGTMRAGCHTLTWPAIEEVARSVGVFEEAPSCEALEERKAA